MKILSVLFAALVLSGCSIFGDEIDKAARAAGKLVKSYCENTTPDQQTITATKVNEAAAPHSVEVTCAP